HPTAAVEMYTLALHDALPIYEFLERCQEAPAAEVAAHLVQSGAPVLAREAAEPARARDAGQIAEVDVGEAVTGSGEGQHSVRPQDRKSTRLNSSHVKISYAVF